MWNGRTVCGVSALISGLGCTCVSEGSVAHSRRSEYCGIDQGGMVGLWRKVVPLLAAISHCATLLSGAQCGLWSVKGCTQKADSSSSGRKEWQQKGVSEWPWQKNTKHKTQRHQIAEVDGSGCRTSIIAICDRLASASMLVASAVHLTTQVAALCPTLLPHISSFITCRLRSSHSNRKAFSYLELHQHELLLVSDFCFSISH